MATLLDLEGQGLLHRLDPGLGPKQQEWRTITVRTRLKDWMLETLPSLESTWKIEQSPLEQLDALTEVFCSGEPLAFGHQLKPLTHIRDGIWELKTADLRMFGWFTTKDHFLGVDADLTDRIKKLKLYRPYCDQAVRYRDGLPLDPPKFVPGDNPHDVVSDIHFP